MTEPGYMSELTFDEPTHVYRVARQIVPHITEIVPSDYENVLPAVLANAARRGKAAHKATELYDLRTIDWAAVTDEIMPYLAAWILAKEEYQLEFDDYDVERRLYHPIHKYAGTGDRPRAWITPPGPVSRRRLATIEIKTIAKMDENVGLQLAGQQCAENYRARALGIEETVERWAFQLKSDGTYSAVPYTNKHHERVFLSYATCLKWEVQLGKRQFAIQRSNGYVGAFD